MVYTQNDLKKMSRKDLLEILVLQSKKIDKLQSELDETKELLDTKMLMISEVGSIADASLKLNKVFECAQEAADQYLENIKRLEEEQVKLCEKLEQQTSKKKITQKKKKNSTSKKKK